MNVDMYSPHPSRNRVHDLAVVSISMMEIVSNLQNDHESVLKDAAPTARRRQRGDDPIARLLSDEPRKGNLVSRAGHYAIQMTWDAYQASIDDYAGFVIAWKEKTIARHMGLPIPTKEEIFEKLTDERRKYSKPDEACKALKLKLFEAGGHPRAKHLKAVAKSIRRLRDHLTHGLGHIDHEWSSKTEFQVCWFDGLKVEEWQDDPPRTLPEITHKRFDLSTQDKVWAEFSCEQVEGIVASIVVLASLTLSQLESVYVKQRS